MISLYQKKVSKMLERLLSQKEQLANQRYSAIGKILAKYTNCMYVVEECGDNAGQANLFSFNLRAYSKLNPDSYFQVLTRSQQEQIMQADSLKDLKPLIEQLINFIYDLPDC